jgi:hypothetical protein
MKKQFLMAAVLSFAFALTGCGGGGGEVLQATRDTTVDINPDSGPATTTAVRNTAFNFPSGVPDFGTSSSTTVTFTAAGGTSSTLGGTSNATGFSVTSGTQTATGTVNFGSCIFTVQNSTFPTSSPLGEGKDITISPCSLFINTAGEPADAQARARIVRLILRIVASSNVLLQVSVNSQGTVFINQIPVGSVPVVVATGVTGA